MKLEQKCDPSNKDDNEKQAIKMPDKPPKGSWQMKVPLGHAISLSICSSPRVRD